MREIRRITYETQREYKKINKFSQIDWFPMIDEWSVIILQYNV